ncbi:putative immunoglobulin-like, Filamin family [Helianthus annuus]|uniref:protein GAMETE EXPRESSED 2 isoform X2 n=1 Tax=Helianthus annuus TaxID=4232 RepID=UPI000B8F4C6B|nr:protein GAMETE EXPRESSED 2 isoform X2 [Helianthus annuus]KAJ0594638.1 putative immunoglobulin-like, Filamin family [Helianthus annuus]KAJ0609685.1 putative immunoglobulin-like, Filamin family [Helianthus annuus]KAJ0769735.1 putative immunoglobulin-like, Filamin family [Helianthus annuus]KAJ0775461.1 putative immunoglobulin-like, Filamin family [Helianthus annuus]
MQLFFFFIFHSNLSKSSSTMSSHVLFCNAYTLIVFFMLPYLSTSDDFKPPRPIISFHLDNWKMEYRAGETAAIVVSVLEGFESKQDEQAFNPSVSMNGVMGNSSLVTGLWFDRNNWRIFFMPIMTGSFHVSINDDRFNVHSYSIHYRVNPGPIYESGGAASWMGQVDDFVAGSKATVLIQPKDAFGNNVTNATEGQNIYNFDVYATTLNGSNARLLDISNKGWNEFGYVCITFVTVTAGHLSVHIKQNNNSLIGSPLPLTVHPEAVDIANCLAHWSTETKSFQLFSRMETFVSQRDKFGNLVPGLHDFDIEVMQKGSLLPIPLTNLQYKEISPGIQSFSFTVVKPGDFILIISAFKEMIMDMPYDFSIYTGYCDDPHSRVHGPGIHDSIAGLDSRFTVSLKDAYQYPSLIELERLQVQITLPSLSLRVNPQIRPRGDPNGTQPTGMLSYGVFDPTGMTYAQSDFSHDNSVENSKTTSSDFDVHYVPEKTGVYEIRIFCGNIPLNGGHPFIKKVHPANVNMSLSGVLKYDKKVSAGILNYIVVQLMDSFYNPVVNEKSRLKLEMTSKTGAAFFPCLFNDNYDGTYTGSYLAYGPGDFELCISFMQQKVLPWPFKVQAFDAKEFPSVRDDEVDAWEDQSAVVNVLNNDIVFDDKRTICEFQKPSHGSLLQYGDLLRYTPYKGFYGHDKFVYKMANAHGNTGHGCVNIYVRTIPPQFVSYPKLLHAVEDTLSPQFGGYPGFEMIYSDPTENISVIVTAQKGTVFLSPLLMQLWDPMWTGITVSKMEGGDERLNITGRLGAVNFALKSLQYIGNANFAGEDTVALSSSNINGEGHVDVKIFVEPVNDPPLINVPKFIILENATENKGLLIFDRQRYKFNFSIGDPDHPYFTGNGTRFRVMFSVEVSTGTFSAKLPAQLISTTELKLNRSKQWQPLVTFVQISKHFTVNKVQGIRFLGTINECNTLLHHLVYYGDKHGVFRLRVNDMGWHGCYPNCFGMMSVPLMSEATVHLMTTIPLNPLVAHSLGSAVLIESIVVSSLAVILMVFTCKCVIILVREKKKQQAESLNLQLNELQNSHEKMSSSGSPDNVIQLTGKHPSSFRQSEQPSSLRKPDEETNVAEIATMIL